MIDGRNFHDQNIAINDSFKVYDEAGKTTVGTGDDYIRGCFLNYNTLKITIN